MSASQTLPLGAEPILGITYFYDLLTHCGIQFLTTGETVWESETALPDPERVPDSSGTITYTGYIHGALRLMDEDKLIFQVQDAGVKNDGTSIVFIRSSTHPGECA